MQNVVPMTMTLAIAQKLIRELAADSSKVVLVGHGKKRGRQRAINFAQALKCLQRGTVSEGPYQTAAGDWRCNVFRHAAGEEMTCVVEFDLPRGLLIITVF